MQRTRDLFDDSTMTFGEHLEVLRVHVFRALVGFVLAVLVCFWFADDVVSSIQVPMETALYDFFIETALDDLKKDFDVPIEMEAFIRKERYVFEVVYIERSEVERLSRILLDQNGEAVPGPPDTYKYQTRFWKPVEAKLMSLSAQEAFVIWIKGALVSGFILGSPWIFYQIWQFVVAGLYPHERRTVYIYMPMSICLFLTGAAFCFLLVFPFVLDFLLSFNRAIGVTPNIRLSEWVGFALQMPLMFGVSFQLPLVMLFLERIGVTPVQTYLHNWRLAVLIISIASMLLTPSDPMSMLLMMAPLLLLYVFGILLCRLRLGSKSDPLA